jgi:hypothetical protein
MSTVESTSPACEPVSVRRGRLELGGFRYDEPRAVFVHGGLKKILTSDFVETCHHDHLELAIAERSVGWTIHSAAPLSRRTQAAILREAARRQTGRTNATGPSTAPTTAPVPARPGPAP